MQSKPLVSLAALTLFALASLASAFAGSTPNFCTNRLLWGKYGFTVQGAKLSGPGFLGSQVGVAMATFNGDGTFTQIDTVTIDGNVVADFTHTPANGTYTVNPDCTGTFTVNFTDGRPTVTTNFVLVDWGNEIDTVVTSAGGAQGVLATASVGKRLVPVR